eukprot:213775_1
MALLSKDATDIRRPIIEGACDLCDERDLYAGFGMRQWVLKRTPNKHEDFSSNSIMVKSSDRHCGSLCNMDAIQHYQPTTSIHWKDNKDMNRNEDVKDTKHNCEI